MKETPGGRCVRLDSSPGWSQGNPRYSTAGDRSVLREDFRKRTSEGLRGGRDLRAGKDDIEDSL